MRLPSLELDERRLWQAIGAVLGVSLILVFAAIQFPWWTASFYPDEVQELRGSFEFSVYTLDYYQDGEQQPCSFRFCGAENTYADGSGMGTVMDRTSVFMALGLVCLVGYLALLLGFYYGKVASQRLVVSVGFAALGFLVIGIVYFTLTIGEAGVAEVERLFDRGAAAMGFGDVERPEPKFWGTQEVSGNDLVSAPAVGWLLAILGVVNLAFGTVLLYRFPEAAEEPEAEYDVADEGDAAQDARGVSG